MQAETLDGRYGRKIALDVCFTCAAFWFDAHESLGLAPGAVLQLFTLIHERQSEKRGGALDSPSCPRCAVSLHWTHDAQRGVRFSYWGCARCRGRLTNFVEFLREKNFVRPLGVAELEALGKQVCSVHCDSCGAPIELAKGSTCSFCGAAVSVLDSGQIERVVHELRAAEEKSHTIDPRLPAQLLADRLDVERFHRELDAAHGSVSVSPGIGLVGLGLAAVVDLLRRRD